MMAWIALSDPNARKKLQKYGITWNVDPTPFDADLEVNGKLLRRRVRRAGLGDLTVTSGHIGQQATSDDSYVDADGITHERSVKPHVKIEEASVQIDLQKEPMGGIFPAFVRPDVGVKLDHDAMATRMRSHDGHYSVQWARQLNRGIGRGIVGASVKHNIVNTLKPWVDSNEPRSVRNSAKTYFFATKGIALALTASTVSSWGHGLAAVARSAVVNSCLMYAFGSFMNATSPKPQRFAMVKDLKPSLTPVLPIDNVLYAMGHRALGRNFVRVAKTPELPGR